MPVRDRCRADGRRRFGLYRLALVAAIASFLTVLVLSRLPHHEDRPAVSEPRVAPHSDPSDPDLAERRKVAPTETERPRPTNRGEPSYTDRPENPPNRESQSASTLDPATESYVEATVPPFVRPTDDKPDRPRSWPDDAAPEATSTDDEPVYRSLSGWVFDRQGAPIPNFLVTAAARRLLSPPGSDEHGGAGRSAHTDTNGAFVFPRLPDGEYLLSTAETEIYEQATATIRAGVNSAVLSVDEKSGRPHLVYGTVESARGGFVDGVRVEPVGQARNATHTDELGNYSLDIPLRAGRNQQIRFLKEGFRQTRLAITPDPSNEQLLLNAILEPEEQSAQVAGSVMGDDGSSVYLAIVQLYSARLGRSYRTSSDRQGGFEFPEIEVGDDYRLWVRPRARYKDVVQENVIVTSGGLELPVVAETITEGRLTGQMVDPDGKAVAGYSLWLVTNFGGAARPVRGDNQGRFDVEVPEGEFVFQTRADPWLSVTGKADQGDTKQTVSLVLDLGSHSLGGTVADDAGAPVAGAQVSLSWSLDKNGSRSRSRRQSVSDASGYFLFTQLGSGIHAISVQAIGFSSARLEHDVGADDHVVVVHLPGATP